MLSQQNLLWTRWIRYGMWEQCGRQEGSRVVHLSSWKDVDIIDQDGVTVVLGGLDLDILSL